MIKYIHKITALLALYSLTSCQPKPNYETDSLPMEILLANNYTDRKKALEIKNIPLDDAHCFNANSDTIITFIPDIHTETYAKLNKETLDKILDSTQITSLGLEGLSERISTLDRVHLLERDYELKNKIESLEDFDEKLELSNIDRSFLNDIDRIYLKKMILQEKENEIIKIKCTLEGTLYESPGLEYLKNLPGTLKFFGLEDPKLYLQGIIEFNYSLINPNMIINENYILKIKIDREMSFILNSPDKDDLDKRMNYLLPLIESENKKYDEMKDYLKKIAPLREPQDSVKVGLLTLRNPVWLDNTLKYGGQFPLIIGGLDHLEDFFERAKKANVSIITVK